MIFQNVKQVEEINREVTRALNKYLIKKNMYSFLE